MHYDYATAGWAILLAIALTAPIVMMRLSRTPAPTMLESIRDVLR